MTLHMIRHGLTAANEKHLYCGITDVPLCERGKQLLGELKRQITYPNAECFFVSGLTRAVETLNILYDNPQYHVISDLSEMNFGEFEMHSYEQLKDLANYQAWLSDIDNYIIPGGESNVIFTQRIARGLADILRQCEENDIDSAVLLTHGGVIATLMMRLFDEGRNYFEWQPVGGKGYSVLFDDGHAVSYRKIQEGKCL